MFITIKYINHSGFLIENDKIILLIDCCGLNNKSTELQQHAGKRLYILVSHAHGDHFDPGILSIDGTGRKYILSSDIRRKIKKQDNIQFLRKGEVYQDDLVNIKAYGSTDVGVSFYIETDGYRIFHAGDLNNWHWNEEETPEDAAKNEKAYQDELEYIAREVHTIDAVIFPVDPRLGKDYTLGAEQFLDRIKTGLFIPMHFWGNFGAALAFKHSAEKRGCDFAEINSAGDEFIIRSYNADKKLF